MRDGSDISRLELNSVPSGHYGEQQVGEDTLFVDFQLRSGLGHSETFLEKLPLHQISSGRGTQDLRPGMSPCLHAITQCGVSP